MTDDGEPLSQAVARLTEKPLSAGPNPPRQIRANLGRDRPSMYESPPNDWARVDREKRRGYEAIRAACASGEHDLLVQLPGGSAWERVDIEACHWDDFDFNASSLTTRAGCYPVRLFFRTALKNETERPPISTPKTQSKRRGIYLRSLRKKILEMNKTMSLSDLIKKAGPKFIAQEFASEYAEHDATLPSLPQLRNIEIQVEKILDELERKAAHMPERLKSHR